MALVNTMAFNSTNSSIYAISFRSKRPIYSHYNIIGHTVDKCYKLHGYPPGYKSRMNSTGGRGFSSSQSVSHQAQANQVSNSSPGSPATTLFVSQCQQIIDFLHSQLHASSSSSSMYVSSSISSSSSSPTDGPFVASFTGIILTSSFSSSIPPSSWILDIGATHHVCCSRSHFTSFTPIFGSKVTLPTGLTTFVTHIGTIQLTPSLLLQNVLFAPSFRFNLLSVSTVQFLHDSCFIQDLSQGIMIGMGSNNLYYLSLGFASNCNLSCNTFTATTNATNASPSIHELWHYRLGHLSFVKLNVLHEILDISYLSNTNLHCSICPLAKQRCLPFVSSNNMFALPFDLVHCDIWGPFHVPTVEGFRYILTIVDDCSRATWIYLLCNKSDAKEIILRFFALIHTQFEVQIKAFRSDNAHELQFPKFFASHGVTHYHSCVETPQQNSVVERKHHHLFNVARALMFQAHLPLSHWGDCVLIAAYLINRFPSHLLSHKTPFEILYHKKPSYNHLRAFGCLCFASTSSTQCSKFSPRVWAAIFLGYPFGYKGYKLLDLSTNQIFISRNVQFHEMIFPFIKTSPTSHDFFSNRVSPSSSISSSNSARPQRVTRPPPHLNDYHCYLTKHD